MLLGLDEENDFNPLERIADPEPGPDRVFENNETRERIWSWADFILREVLTAGSPAGLNERELEILRLRCIAKRPSREVAKLFSMKTGAVDTVLSRAKKKIRDFCDAKGLLNDIRETLRDVVD
jgi:DNA-directed RNA polymerase specialized sigma24 family protein